MQQLQPGVLVFSSTYICLRSHVQKLEMFYSISAVVPNREQDV